MDRAIIVDRLTKNFVVTKKRSGLVGSLSSLISPEKKLVRALNRVSFSIREGELVSLIGPNGAGKTTIMKILSGILFPTDGFVSVMGYTPSERREEFLRKISLVMGSKNQLWWDLPAIETLELNRAIYNIPKGVYKKNLDELCGILDVYDLLSIRVRKLSLGQRMKFELIASLLHNPEIVFMDEPTIGLDIIAQKKLRDFISDYNRLRGATIVFTSHNMGDVVNLSKRVIVIAEGRIIFDGGFSELVAKYASLKTIKIYLSREIDYKKLEEFGEVKKINFPEVTIVTPRSVSKVAAAELLQNFPINDLTIEEENIDDVISRVFRSKTRISVKRK